MNTHSGEFQAYDLRRPRLLDAQHRLHPPLVAGPRRISNLGGPIMAYGQELILDLSECNEETFTREGVELFMMELCDLIDMEREDLHFWDYADASPEELDRAKQNPHTFGVSAVQFIITSSIVIHCLPLLRQCYLNVFSCKSFDIHVVTDLALRSFGADGMTRVDLIRGG